MIIEEDDDEIIVAVVSGKGDDALELAEKLYDEFHPEIVLRLTPKRKGKQRRS